MLKSSEAALWSQYHAAEAASTFMQQHGGTGGSRAAAKHLQQGAVKCLGLGHEHHSHDNGRNSHAHICRHVADLQAISGERRRVILFFVLHHKPHAPQGSMAKGPVTQTAPWHANAMWSMQQSTAGAASGA